MPTPNINITVSGPTITCAPNSLNLTAINSATDITFTLVTPNYTFPATASVGIAIVDNDSSFSSYTRNSDTLITVHDLNSDGQTHTYTVAVLDANGNTIESDPMIVNRGSN